MTPNRGTLRNLTLTFLVLFILIFTLGCTIQEKQKTTPGATETIKIGILADLTGDYANFLRGIHQGSQLAIDDLNAQGKSLTVYVGDQHSCDTKQTAMVMNQFINAYQVDLIIGGSCSSTTLAAVPFAEASKTLMISPSSSAPSISQAGEYIFRTYIADTLRGKKIGELAYQLGKRSMVMITDASNDAMIEVANEVKRTFSQRGGTVVLEETVSGEDNDFRTPLLKVKNKADVLVLNLGPRDLALAAKQAKELGINVQLLSPIESAEDTSVFTLAGNALEGLIYIIPGNPPETEAYKKLIEKYEQKYGSDPASPGIPAYTAEAYDAVILGVQAIASAHGNREDAKNALYKVSKSYQGVSGPVAFDEFGDVHKEVQVKQIRNGKYVAYEMN